MKLLCDLMMAILLAIIIVAGILLVPILLAVFMPLVLFLGLVFVVWFSIQVFRDDDTKGSG